MPKFADVRVLGVLAKGEFSLYARLDSAQSSLHVRSVPEKAMTTPPDDKLVSIVGESYFQPIAILLNELISLPEPATNDVKTSYYENGFACAVCLLAVVCFESYTMRLRFFNRSAPAAEKRHCLDFLRELYPQFNEEWLSDHAENDPESPNIEQMTEAFVLRDIIAHNHLWEIGFSWGELSEPMTLQSAVKDAVSGDNKYALHVDAQTRKTKILHLNAVPLKIDRSDVSKVLKVVWNALLFLESQDPGQCPVSHVTVRYGGEFRRFGEVVRLFANGRINKAE